MAIRFGSHFPYTLTTHLSVLFSCMHPDARYTTLVSLWFPRFLTTWEERRLPGLAKDILTTRASLVLVIMVVGSAVQYIDEMRYCREQCGNIQLDGFHRHGIFLEIPTRRKFFPGLHCNKCVPSEGNRKFKCTLHATKYGKRLFPVCSSAIIIESPFSGREITFSTAGANENFLILCSGRQFRSQNPPLQIHGSYESRGKIAKWRYGSCTWQGKTTLLPKPFHHLQQT